MAVLADVEAEPVPTTVEKLVIFNSLLFHGQISPVKLHLILVPLQTVQVLGLVRVSEHGANTLYLNFSNPDQITLTGQKREMVY